MRSLREEEGVASREEGFVDSRMYEGDGDVGWEVGGGGGGRVTSASTSGS